MNKGKILRYCEICQKVFHTFQSEIRRGGGKFCSVLCYRKSQFGREFSKERRKKISLALKGKIVPKERRERIRLSLKGREKPNANRKNCKICGISFKDSPANGKTLCSRKCRTEFFSVTRSGPNHPNWKGGLTPGYLRDRRGPQYKEWRIAVFTRDGFTCQECGKVGRELQADHIKPFAFFPELRFEISNGRTLCKECHKKTDTYLNRWLKNK